LDVLESVGDVLIILARIVDDDGKEERLTGRHQVRSIDRELPLKTEIPLVTIVGVPRNHRDEEHTALDLLADRLVPSIPAAKRALIEPDLETARAQCLANPLGHVRILRGVA
jgi:hypothetical protein